MRHLLLALLLTACGSKSSDTPTTPPTPTPSDSPVVATLEREPCFGFCPVYKVAVHADGTVKYEGIRSVKTKGEATGSIGAEGVEQLHAAFAAADYFNLQDEYVRMEITDLPYANTSYTKDGRSKAVRHYAGDRTAPEALTKLEQEIDRIVNIEQWIGTDEERQQTSAEWR